MFGLTTPARDWTHTTPPEERPCQLCHALEADYGRPFRLLTNYDAGFLLSLLESQARTPSPQLSSSLHLGGSVCRPYKPDWAPDYPRYVAAVLVTWFGIKLRDDIHDTGRITSRWLYRVIQRPIRRAAQTLLSLGLDPARLAAEAESQPALEVSSRPTLATLSGPTARATALVFAHTANLASTPANRPILEHLGETFGRLAYTTDAYHDFDRDQRRGQFNALWAVFPEARQRRRRDIPFDLQQAWFAQSWAWSQDILADLDALALARRSSGLNESITVHLCGNLLRTYRISPVNTPDVLSKEDRS
jgi:hypothetical protein